MSANPEKHFVKSTSRLTNLRKHFAKLHFFPQACFKGFLNCLCEMKGIVQVGTHQSSRGLRAPARPCPRIYRVFRSRRSAISGIYHGKIQPSSGQEFENTSGSVDSFGQLPETHRKVPIYPDKLQETLREVSIYQDTLASLPRIVGALRQLYVRAL